MTEEGADLLAQLPPIDDVVAGKYRVTRLLGEGGMGAVYEVEHLHLKQRLAMKYLHPKIAMVDEVVTRFLMEARAVGKLRSDHVVQVTDVDTLEDGRPYMVMELLAGYDLAQDLVQRGKIPVEEAVGYLIQACAGVAAAHAEGIIHRDLKPANLFVATTRGAKRLKILDFGISKVLQDENVGLTQTQSVFGTPIYMSPEHLRSAKKVDARSDIWALGVILYELVTGRAPFDGDSVTALAAAISLDEPAPLRLAGLTDAPPALEKVLRKALAKDAAQRYQSVAEFAEALAPLADEDGRALARRIAREAGVAPAGPANPLPQAPTPVHASTIEPTSSSNKAAPTARSMRTGIFVGVGIGAVALAGGLVWKATRTETVVPRSTAAATAAVTAERPQGTTLIQTADPKPTATEAAAPPPEPPPVAAPSEPPQKGKDGKAKPKPSATPSAKPTAGPKETGAPPPPPHPPPRPRSTTPAENPTFL